MQFRNSKSITFDSHLKMALSMDNSNFCHAFPLKLDQAKNTLHYVLLEIQKVLTKLSKEKNCEIIGRWRRSCVRHFYWAVTSTQEHLGEVKLAKFEAFFSHVLNKHNNLPNRLFNACAHANITTPRLWMAKGMINVLMYSLTWAAKI